MLLNKNLDDKNFEVLMSESIEELQKYKSEWTDHNLHDPGITFIELLAWLTELQRYYMNRMSDKSKESLFKLLGIIREQKTSAISSIVLSNITDNLLIPKGMKFSAEKLVFESTKSHWILANKIKLVHVAENDRLVDRTRENTYESIYFYPFGQEVCKDNKFYIGFEKALPVNIPIEITFLNDKSYELASHELTNSDLFNIDIVWEIYTTRKKWEAIEVITDKSQGLSVSGTLSVKIKNNMASKTVMENTESAYWIRGVVASDYSEIPTPQDRIRLNIVKVEEKNQLVSFCDYDLKEEFLEFKLEDYLQLFGENYIQLGNKDTWVDISKVPSDTLIDEFYVKDKTLEYSIDKLRRQIICHTKDHEDSVLRIISIADGYLHNTIIGSSLGLSNQRFDLHIYSLVYESLSIQVGEYRDGKLTWIQWHEVNTLDFSSSTDRHFKVDYKKSQLVFGDDIHGRIPVMGSNNIRIISASVGGGESGNIRVGKINSIFANREKFEELYPYIKYKSFGISNIIPASYGKDREGIKELQKRLLQDLKKPYVAVKALDYEMILKDMPTLAIDRCHVVPNYNKKLNKEENGHITIVIIPKSGNRLPIPTENFKGAVKKYLDNYRLITTQLHIAEPSYIKIDIAVVVYLKSNAKVKKSDITDSLNTLLDPKGSKEVWRFGDTVKKSTIYRHLSSISGVERIESLVLRATHKDSLQKANGDILINDYCIPYSGNHDINIVMN